jgi:ABC-type transporter MlaC component
MSVMTTPKRFALAGALLLAMPGPANAEAIETDAARKFVADLGVRAVGALRPPSSKAERSIGFTGIMLEYLDFDAIGLAALGRLARTTTPEQMREFTPLFTAYVIDVTIEKLGNLQIMTFDLGGVASQPNGDAKVYTRITADDRQMDVYWRVRNSGGTAKINDIEIAGASLAIHYHGEFDRAGVDNTLPQLIARLKELTKSSKTLATVVRGSQ